MRIALAKVIAGMSMSLDGFVADSAGSTGCLYPDLAALQGSAFMNAMVEETGAVLMGRRTLGMGEPDSYVGSYEFQVPIFVLTHRSPLVAPKQDEQLTFSFVTDGVDSAMAQAKEAAADKAVTVVGGVSVVAQLLSAALVDELHVDLMPVLIGSGLRLFKNIDPDHVRLEKLAVREVGVRTSLRFQVVGRPARAQPTGCSVQAPKSSAAPGSTTSDSAIRRISASSIRSR